MIEPARIVGVNREGQHPDAMLPAPPCPADGPCAIAPEQPRNTADAPPRAAAQRDHHGAEPIRINADK